jgi:hypothetical protein
MKKLSLFVIAFITLTLNFAFGDPVDKETAAQVAKTFCTTSTIGKTLVSADISLAYTERSVSARNEKSGELNEFPVFYIFNVNQNDGFVIIAADNDVSPVLGYITSGNYTGRNVPPPFRKLLELYKDQIRFVVVNHLKADAEIMVRWENLENGRSLNSSKNTRTVSPLLSTTWNQSPYENQMCPADYSGPGGHCVTGCPATAMAQIMKFWNSPANGTGFHSYNASNSNGNYGTLSADFGSTSYDWGSMPNHLDYNNDAVALLMFHCGVAVEMNYGPNGSGGWVIENDQNGNHPYCSEIAYKTYFGYQSSIQGLMRANYSDNDWKQMLKTDLDAGRPVQYAGWGTGGHTFVCDGYDQNTFFHMNWGWGGSSDGFFDLDGLNPGTDDFNSNQQAVFGIQPGSSSGSSDMVLYSAISVSSNPVTFGQGFTVTADILNNGSTAFTGDFCAALFTSDGIFVDYIETLTGANLQPGYYYDNVEFTTAGINAATPGEYQIALYSRPTGGGWTILGPGEFTNIINVTISGSANDIGLYSDITVNQNPIIIGQPFTATTDIANYGTTDFTGDFSLDLHASDGTWIQTIEEYDNQTLQVGYYFNDITFSSTGLSVQPGDYYLVAWDRPSGGEWELVGSSDYSNPISVVLQGQPLNADIFEPDNSEAAAHSLPVSFSGNNAHITTDGSNIHSSDDIDYYKLDLPAGYFYFIDARVHDSYNSGNGQTYTADVMFDFKWDGKWSDAFDTQMPTSFEMPGGSIIFNVFPYFPGESGTYLLEFNILRSLTGIENSTDNNDFKVFPNPAKDRVTFNFNLKQPEIVSGYLSNIYGQKVLDIPAESYQAGTNMINTDISSLSPGCYFYRFESKNGRVTGKFVVSK